MDLRFFWFCWLLKMVRIGEKHNSQEIFEGFVAEGRWVPAIDQLGLPALGRQGGRQ